MKYPCHNDEKIRLNRIIGQLQGVKKMIDEQKYCPDILSQIQAARGALQSISARVLEKHIRNCVYQSFENEEERDKKIAELIYIFKKNQR